MSIPFVAHSFNDAAYYVVVEEWKRRFDTARKAKGYSYADLAGMLQRRGRKITEGAIAHWFRETDDPNNKRNMNVADLIALCEETGIDIAHVTVGQTIDDLVKKRLRKLIEADDPPPPKDKKTSRVEQEEET